MDPHSLRPPARRRRGREGDQAVLERGERRGLMRRGFLVETTSEGRKTHISVHFTSDGNIHEE